MRWRLENSKLSKPAPDATGDKPDSCQPELERKWSANYLVKSRAARREILEMATKLGHVSPRGSPSGFQKRHYTSLDTDERRSTRVKGSQPFAATTDMESGVSLLEESLHLDRVGPVTAVIHGDRILWRKGLAKNVEPKICECCGPTSVDEGQTEILLSEVYGVQALGRGPIYDSSPLPLILSSSCTEMHRFVIHTYNRSPSDRCKWVPKECVFGHINSDICQVWVDRIQQLLERDLRRPKQLLVIVNPYGGKRQGVEVWEQLVPLFKCAAVNTEVVITERQGHAFDIVDKATEEELQARDGVVIVGGDGLFGEVLNGLLARRHKTTPAPKPRTVSDLVSEPAPSSMPSQESQTVILKEPEAEVLLGTEGKTSFPAAKGFGSETLGSRQVLKTEAATEEELKRSSFLGTSSSHPKLRIGLIPAGSTDTIVVSTIGTRDPVTAALHILLGDRMPLDIVRVTGWKKTVDEDYSPTTRYAASFAAYGFYGEVARESETLRWMGPSRYDFAGFEVFMRHRKFEADISFLEMPYSHNSTNSFPHGPWPHAGSGKTGYAKRALDKIVCRMNCSVCAKSIDLSHMADSDMEESDNQSTRPRWRTLPRAHYHSIGAAVMSCRNEKAPDGVSAHAHLADGLLHLILIRNCSRFDYLRQLLRLTRKGADPLNFGFIEHYKTPVFTFIGHGKESVWSVDGEIFPARQLTAQVFRGLVDVFARGPEV